MQEADLAKLKKLIILKDKNALNFFLDELAKLSHKENFLQHFYDALNKKKLVVFDAWLNYAAVIISSGGGERKCKQDQPLAFKLYMIAANNNFEHACGNVANAYFYGLGVEVNVDEAEKYCIKSIARSSDSEHRIRNIFLGKIYLKKNDLEKAEEAFNKIKPEDKEHYAEARLNLGLIYGQKKNYKSAIEYFKSVQSGSNIHQDALKVIEALRKKANDIFNANKVEEKEVSSVCKEILENINDDHAFDTLAHISYYEGDLRRAFTWLNKISLEYPSMDKVWEFKKKIFKQKLHGVLPKRTVHDSSGETKEGEKIDANPEAGDIKVYVKDSRWISLSEELDGFTGKDLAKYEKLEKYFADDDKFEKSLADLQDELGVVKEQLKTLKNNPEKEAVIKEGLLKQQKKLEEKMEFLKNQEEKRRSLKKKWESLTKVEEKRRKRIKATEERFFNPNRESRSKKSRKFIRKMANRLSDNRFAESNEAVEPILAENHPARRLITAEKAVLMSTSEFSASKDICWRSNTKNKEPWNVGYNSGYNLFSNREIITMGADTKIEYKQRSDPKPQRPGDAKVLDIGSYGQIYKVINSICNDNEDKEKALAELMRKFSHEGKSVTDEDVAKLLEKTPDSTSQNNSDSQDNNDVLTPEEIHEKTLYLNRACFLAFIKEPTEWFESSDPERRYEYLTAQARVMRLLCEGYLRMHDVFSSDAPYGVFTGTNLINSKDEMQKKIENIHRLYEKWLERQNDKSSMAFFKGHNHPSAMVLATRKQHRSELQYLYGGESDTDGEGYESDGNEMAFELPSVLSNS